MQLQSISNPVSKQVDASENEQKIEPEKCAPTENQNDCIKVDALNQIDEKDICNANSAIDCKPVASVSMEEVILFFHHETIPIKLAVFISFLRFFFVI